MKALIWKFAGIRSIGWGWTGVIWIYNIVTYMLLDPIKFVVRYGLSGKPWTQMFEQRIAFTERRDFGQEQRVAAWATEQRSVHGLENPLGERGNSSRDLMADDSKRRAELAKTIELQTLKGKVESSSVASTSQN
ncbi:hypothetical protein F2Q69_00018041 [Brassica cretica]|uniref:Uncharacterized protein n=1 Tax=Brassica cretica TaxID=69181 RepID=A0A8S9QRP9_BRACR|nr:hypothetical protein F2Q69_00018041 [Brassica cretica]